MWYVRTVVKTLDCANFCAHPTDRWAHLRTAGHMLPSPLSCFVSAGTLKTGRLFSVVRLPWAQEAPVRIRAPRPLICKSFGYTQRCSEGKRWRKKYVPLNLVSAHWANLGRYREIGDARAHRDLLDGGARHHRIDHRWRR